MILATPPSANDTPPFSPNDTGILSSQQKDMGPDTQKPRLSLLSLCSAAAAFHTHPPSLPYELSEHARRRFSKEYTSSATPFTSSPPYYMGSSAYGPLPSLQYHSYYTMGGYSSLHSNRSYDKLAYQGPHLSSSIYSPLSSSPSSVPQSPNYSSSSSSMSNSQRGQINTATKENSPYPIILPKVSENKKDSSMQSRKDSYSLFTLELLHDYLWTLFAKNKNEMIITRFGRCLFPSLRFKVEMKKNCPGDLMAVFGLQIVKTSAKRLKYRQGAWVTNTSYHTQSHVFERRGSKHAASLQNIHWHPSGVQPLSFWAKYGLSFLDAKLTNGKKLFLEAPLKSQQSQQRGSKSIHSKISLIPPGTEAPFVSSSAGVLFQLESFYEYTPRIVCRLYSVLSETPLEPSSSASASAEPAVPANLALIHSKTISFPQCAFIAVTHYQNPAINSLKKQYNPHAKGFIPDITSASPDPASDMVSMNKEDGDEDEEDRITHTPQELPASHIIEDVSHEQEHLGVDRLGSFTASEFVSDETEAIASLLASWYRQKQSTHRELI